MANSNKKNNKRTFSWIHPDLEVRDTEKYGKGVYALRNIKSGEVIHVLSGEIISFEECIKRIRGGKEAQTDSLQIDLEMDMDLDELSRTFNHSCNPNAAIRKISELVAIRNIKKGEEITYDYSATIGPNVPREIWEMKCLCGSDNCRKIIGNIMSIPMKQLREYKRVGLLQDYIIKELDIILLNNGKLPKYNKILI